MTEQDVADSLPTDAEGAEATFKRIGDQLKAYQSGNAARYSANAHILFAAYTFLKVNVTQADHENEYTGHGGGGGVPGVSVFGGDLYTDDIDRLYRDSFSFQFNVGPFHMSVVFFDGNSNVLGTFQGGGIGLASAIGGGKGQWSHG